MVSCILHYKYGYVNRARHICTTVLECREGSSEE